MTRVRVGIGVAGQRARNRALSLLARPAARAFRAIPHGDRAARFLLERTWAYLPAGMLDAYLVSGYQNPRINPQSILLRHHLVRSLFGAEFDGLMEDEIRFSIECNQILSHRAQELGVVMGSYIDPVRHAGVKRVDSAIAGRETEFAERWAAALVGRQGPRLSVLEFACGSANDYRAFVEYGIAPFLDYRGVDLTAKNIANARRRFPGVRFDVGDILHLGHPDGAFDCVIASDVFEHLAIDDMERAVDEAVRMARRSAVLTFFSMSDGPEHAVRPKGAYHWNRLSRRRVEERLVEHFPSVSAIPISRWLAERYGYRRGHGRYAWTIIAERPAAPSER